MFDCPLQAQTSPNTISDSVTFEHLCSAVSLHAVARPSESREAATGGSLANHLADVAFIGDRVALTLSSWPLLHAKCKLTPVAEAGTKPATTARAGACCNTMCEEYDDAKDRVDDIFPERNFRERVNRHLLIFQGLQLL